MINDDLISLKLPSGVPTSSHMKLVALNVNNFHTIKQNVSK